MKLLSERNQIREVAGSWRDQYFVRKGGEWGKTMYGPTEPVYVGLLALDVETATIADVDKIIRVGGWVAPVTCHECGAATWDCVQLGQEPDYDSSTASICCGCLRAALALGET